MLDQHSQCVFAWRASVEQLQIWLACCVVVQTHDDKATATTRKSPPLVEQKLATRRSQRALQAEEIQAAPVLPIARNQQYRYRREGPHKRLQDRQRIGTVNRIARQDHDIGRKRNELCSQTLFMDTKSFEVQVRNLNQADGLQIGRGAQVVPDNYNLLGPKRCRNSQNTKQGCDQNTKPKNAGNAYAMEVEVHL